MQYVSILSPGFSGSTLLSLILASRPRTIGFGDTYFGPQNSPKNLCTCGRTYLECEPRSMISDSIRRKGIEEFSWETASAIPRSSLWPESLRQYWPLWNAASLPAIRKIPAGARRRIFRRFYLENRFFVESLEDSSRYDFYFDGCKNMNRLELLRTAIEDIKVIHMIRHPGALLYHDQKAGVSRTDYRLSQWARYHRRARSFIPLVGESNYFAVPYEAIVQRPKDFRDRVGNFLEASEWSVEDPAGIDRSKAHILGNRMRESVERIVDYSNTWRKHLPREEIALADGLFDATRWASRLYSDWECDLERE